MLFCYYSLIAYHMPAEHIDSTLLPLGEGPHPYIDKKRSDEQIAQTDRYASQSPHASLTTQRQSWIIKSVYRAYIGYRYWCCEHSSAQNR